MYRGYKNRLFVIFNMITIVFKIILESLVCCVILCRYSFEFTTPKIHKYINV